MRLPKFTFAGMYIQNAPEWCKVPRRTALPERIPLLLLSCRENYEKNARTANGTLPAKLIIAMGCDQPIADNPVARCANINAA